MSLVGQWRALESGLPDGWQTAGLRLELRDRETADRAAALLAPAQPFRSEPDTLRFSSARNGTAPGPDGVARLLKRVDDARLGGALTLAGSEAAEARTPRPVTSFVEAWDTALASLPPDWSDLLSEFTLQSTDYIERAAVLCVQMNPRRDGQRAAMQFRCARIAGYGVSPEMARRCFERCDAERIVGGVTVLRVLSDTRLVATQGPVWLMSGRTV